MRNFDLIVNNILDDTVIEEGIMDNIKSMASKGLSIATIAATLSLPLASVQSAVAAQPTVKKSVVAKPKPKSAYEQMLDTVAKTIYHEARGETFTGKKAVASTLYNRAGGDPKKLAKVARARKQYSCWNRGYLPAGKGEAWKESILLARNMLSGNFEPNTNNTHYYNPSIVNPKWAKGVSKERIGRHLFLTVEEVEV